MRRDDETTPGSDSHLCIGMLGISGKGLGMLGSWNVNAVVVVGQP
jgi:hypothetical protein